MKPDYTNSVVYKIVCLDPTITDVYVGSTTNLTVRKYGHKNSCSNVNSKKHNYYVYRFIRDNGGFDNWEFVVVRRYNNIKTKEALLRKERKYVDKLKPTLNKFIPLQTYKEYYEKNKKTILEHKKEYKKKYFQQNKNRIQQRQKEKVQCDCGCLISRTHLARHKQTEKHKQLMEDK